MPIQLATPASGGFITDGESYTHAKIYHWEHDVDPGCIFLHVNFGNYVGEKFVPSSHRQFRQTILIEGQDYIDLVSGATASEGENIYVAVKDALYAWLMSHNPNFTGTVI